CWPIGLSHEAGLILCFCRSVASSRCGAKARSSGGRQHSQKANGKGRRRVRDRVCIISFSLIQRDARVLRQIEYLSREYDLTVIGYGPSANVGPGIQWIPVEAKSSLRTRIMGVLLMVLGRVIPRSYD